jgi:hypothetical protein
LANFDIVVKRSRPFYDVGGCDHRRWVPEGGGFVKMYEDEATCLHCGYSLRGLRAARCPECGREFDPLDPSTFRQPGTASGLDIPALLAYACNGYLALVGACAGTCGAVADVSPGEQRANIVTGLALVASAVLNMILVRHRKHSSSWLLRLGIACTSGILVLTVGFSGYERWRIWHRFTPGVETVLPLLGVGLTLLAVFRRGRPREI